MYISRLFNLTLNPKMVYSFVSEFITVSGGCMMVKEESDRLLPRLEHDPAQIAASPNEHVDVAVLEKWVQGSFLFSNEYIQLYMLRYADCVTCQALYAQFISLKQRKTS